MSNISFDKSTIFSLRKKEHSEIIENVKKILSPLVEDYGFKIVELELKDSRLLTGELEKTISEKLNIIIRKDDVDIDLSMTIPKLVDDQYYIIKGKRKIPMFQLYDYPLVVRGDTIKLKTNVEQLHLSFNKTFPYVMVSFMTRKIPLSLLMFCCDREYALSLINDNASMYNRNNTEIYNQLMADLTEIFKKYDGESEEAMIKELGSYYSRHNNYTRGLVAIKSIELIPRIDIFSAPFMKDGVLKELVSAIEGKKPNDCSLENKRIRCLEYVLYEKLCKVVYSLCGYCLANPKKIQYNTNSNQVMNQINVSDIVQFDRDINPVYELSNISKVTVVGPGGFKKETVPTYLRDVHESMFGRICVVDTPDRENCGIQHDMIPSVFLDDSYAFSKKTSSEFPIGIPVRMVPFCEHDDPTRLQMASSQMRQSILLKEMENPLVKSGFEDYYTDETRYVFRARKNGRVVYIDNEKMIVDYGDKDCDVIGLGVRTMYSDNLDEIVSYYRMNDEIKEGEIIAESKFCKKGSINLGKNLLTGFMIYKGYNYEDGIIISDRLVEEDVLTSRHYVDLSFNIPPSKALESLDKNCYKPLPQIGEVIKNGECYARLKSLPSYPMGYYDIFENAIELKADNDLKIESIEIYANEWNENISQYENFIKTKMNEQIDSEKHFSKVFKTYCEEKRCERYIKENGFDKFAATGKYRLKGEEISGVYVKMIGVFERKIKVGDKLANRHGNKGVISKILPHDQMPMLEDGSHLDICLNCLGIPSRMNVGQVFELHLSAALNKIKNESIKMFETGVEDETIKSYISEFIKIVDLSGENMVLFNETFKDGVTKEKIQDMSVVQVPFKSIKPKHLYLAMSYAGVETRYELFDPEYNQKLENPVAVGYMYMMRLVHIAETKISARSTGNYSKRTRQPLAGKKNKGGQRCGEMESSALIGHGATENLHEFQTTKSDCIYANQKHIRTYFCLDEEMAEEDNTPESVKLLDNNLILVGVKK